MAKTGKGNLVVEAGSVGASDERGEGTDVSAGSGYEPGFGLPDDRVLAELSHELGNHFHKLRYWIDYLKTQHKAADSQGEAATAVHMLETSVENLEIFLRMTLEYFSPARLSFTRLRIEELLRGLSGRLPGRRLAIDGLDRWGATEVFVDPSRINHVVRTVFERVMRTLVEEEEMRIRLEPANRGEFEGVEIEFYAGCTVTPCSKLMTGIEMAVAEKFLKVHGGELFEKRSGTTACLAMFLPLYS